MHTFAKPNLLMQSVMKFAIKRLTIIQHSHKETEPPEMWSDIRKAFPTFLQKAHHMLKKYMCLLQVLHGLCNIMQEYVNKQTVGADRALLSLQLMEPTLLFYKYWCGTINMKITEYWQYILLWTALITTIGICLF